MWCVRRTGKTLIDISFCLRLPPKHRNSSPFSLGSRAIRSGTESNRRKPGGGAVRRIHRVQKRMTPIFEPERRMRNSISAGAHAKAEDGFSASSGPALGKVGPGSHRSGARTAALADAFVTLQRVTCTVDARTGRRSCSSSPLARRAQTAARPRLSWRASLNPRQLLRPGANLVCQCQTEASLPGPHRTCFVA